MEAGRKKKEELIDRTECRCSRGAGAPPALWLWGTAPTNKCDNKCSFSSSSLGV
jgi:hypothetical protein